MCDYFFLTFARSAITQFVLVGSPQEYIFGESIHHALSKKYNFVRAQISSVHATALQKFGLKSSYFIISGISLVENSTPTNIWWCIALCGLGKVIHSKNFRDISF